MASSCKKGYYFCNSSQKCKRIPRGHKVLGNGELVREYVSDWRSDLQEEEPKKSLSDRSFKKLEKRAKNFELDSQEDQDQYALEVNRRMTKVGKNYYTVNRKTDQKNRRGRTVGHNRGLKDHYDWRSELQEVSKEYVDKKQSQFKKDYGIESNPFNLPHIQKSNNEKLAKHKLGGKSFEMTGDGQNINFGKWGADKVNEIGKKATSTIDKATNIATDTKYASRLKSHGTNADEIKKGADEVKSNIKKGGEEAAWRVRRGINQHIKGTPEHQTVGVEKDIALNTDKFKPKKKGLIQNKVVKTEELQGGVSVEPYTKDTKFLEVETVDIIKPKALNASDWRSELEVVNEGSDINEALPLAPLAVAAGMTGASIGGGKLFYDSIKDLPKKLKQKKVKKEELSNWKSELEVVEAWKYVYPNKGRNEYGLPKGLKPGSGGSKEVPLTPTQNRMLVKGNKKDTVAASYEADLENMIIEILEEDINDLHNNGFSYEEIAEFYDVKEELLNEGLVGGAIAGAKIIAKFAPKIAKFAAKRGIKDRKILTKFARNPKNWQRANTDIQKVIDAPKNTYNLGRSFRQFADKGYKALKGGAQKLIEPLKKKGEGDIAKWKKTQEVIKRANRLARSKAEKAGQIVDVAPTTTNLPSAKTSLPLPKKVTKGMTPAEIRHQGMNALAKLQGKTEKTKKAAELTKRMARAVEVSKKPGTYSRKVDDALKLSDPGSIVKSGSSAVTNTKPSGSGLLNRIKNLLTGSKPPKKLTGSKPSEMLTGSKPPKQITGSKSSKNQIPDPWDTATTGTKPHSSKRELARTWMALNKRASVPSDAVTGNPKPPKFTGGKGTITPPKISVSKDKLLGKVATGASGAAGVLGVVAGSKFAKDSKIAKSKTSGDEKGTFSKSKAGGYVVDMPGYDPSDKQSPETIKKINDLTYKQMQKDKEKGPSQGDSSTINGKKVSVTHSSVYGKTPKTTTPKGRTKWVGANTTWVDRHGNVIAPKAKENKKYKYGRTGSHLTPLEQEKAN